jgi:pimeloyl-ACP methyl ester carboxylesterase
MWLGAWCFEGILDELGSRGVTAFAPELSHSGDLGTDAKIVRQALDSAPPPVLLLGHSYGGVAITEAAAGRTDVHHLVYLAAFMPDEQETIRSLVSSVDDQPLAPGKGVLIQDDGSSVIDSAAAAEIFFGDCSQPDADRAAGQLCEERMGRPPRPPTGVAWRQLPSTYIICSKDKALSLTLQRRFAARATTSTTWEASHSPFLSRPQLVAGLIARLAATASAGPTA